MADVPEGSVIITPTEVYNEVRDLTKEVRALVTNDQNDQRERQDLRDRVTKVEDRVGSLEKKLWFVAGLASAFGGGIGSGIAAALAR